jgi:Holliday junction resolvasome RuvABC DNA-binding subunit
MAIDSLNYIDTLENKNVVKHSVNEIINNDLHAHYYELINIRQIGPKISALYLRDIVCFYELDNLITDTDYSFLQPIDTWVNKIAHKIGLTTNTKNMEEIRIKIIKACRENNISSLKFNQGAWYIGSNAYEILLENLVNIE